ncbi:MAG: hypothetical protein OXK16_03790 [bacterium]|nr:hypothetical protein [bacterium]
MRVLVRVRYPHEPVHDNYLNNDYTATSGSRLRPRPGSLHDVHHAVPPADNTAHNDHDPASADHDTAHNDHDHHNSGGLVGWV